MHLPDTLFCSESPKQRRGWHYSCRFGVAPLTRQETPVPFSRGFTIAELITVVAIVAILAATALPLVRFGVRRNKELELRTNLHNVATAIDRYIDLRMKGVIKQPPKIGQNIYPKDIEELTKPIELIDGKKIVLLRERDAIDPMTAKPFRAVSSTDDPESSSSNGDNLWDVRSESTALALDGRTHYSEW